MSAASGIGISPELSDTFSSAVDSKNIRFIKVAIQNETLVPVETIEVSGSFDDDLSQLQTLLDDKQAVYVLARLDEPPSEWLAINYVPDAAPVREKMLYASTRSSLTKSLGSAVFTDSLFATSKDDLTADAYAAHKRSLAAPKPLSAREKEMEDIKAAEKQAGFSYEGSSARKNHIGTGHSFAWDPEAENAMKELGATETSRLVVLAIAMESETLELHSSSEVDINQVGAALPKDQPAYAALAWVNEYSETGRDVLYIYSCPTTSPVKLRMTYSAGSGSVARAIETILKDNGSAFVVSKRKIETSDPAEVDEAFLKSLYEFNAPRSAGGGAVPEVKPDRGFARPKGPARRR
ncbi:actin depolymerizing protein [Coniophora puteana RWD-64-598 SS2]|uniref:Actin depolymerizing protein n=1 Tax=Coniophora puteana (strain RWD-64-598) TaxID=741705 RepID=A0A5M3N2B5_CONPW|nr:actin depolymerizing protein [Coniophora puteana RWD-64-598 SS2]EIW85446.1 actin depolymerizing protein [Coniophora puteana RWD-64-598 SS2]